MAGIRSTAEDQGCVYEREKRGEEKEGEGRGGEVTGWEVMPHRGQVSRDRGGISVPLGQGWEGEEKVRYSRIGEGVDSLGEGGMIVRSSSQSREQTDSISRLLQPEEQRAGGGSLWWGLGR